MALAKQILQFVFGSTDQDTSKKSVQMGNLVSAVNMQQIHAGKHCKRGAFVQSSQTFDVPSTITGESIASPDGRQVIIRDGTTDTQFARSTDQHHNMAKGASKRLMVTWPMRFPARSTGQQATPMAKQAGDYYVWLRDESHFMISKRSADKETKLLAAGPIQATAGGVISHVKSFAVIDSAAFDASNLWIFWVDWSTNADAQQNRDAIFLAKVSHDLQTVTFNRILSGTASNRCLTSICATVTADNLVTVAASIANRADVPSNEFYDFRSDATRVDTGLVVYKYNSTPTLQFSSETIRTSSVGNWTSSGVCPLTTSATAYRPGRCRFALWVGNTSSMTSLDLVMVEVDESTSEQTWTTIETLTNDGHGEQGEHGGRPYFVGSATGYETASGSIIAAQMRIYYHGVDADTWQDPPMDAGLYPDHLWTRIYACSDITGPYVIATVRGAWLASGWFLSDDGIPLIITGWQDYDAVQMPYHLRRLDTGDIIAQFAYGEAAYPGGCATTNGQITDHVCDLNQPMSNTAPLSIAPEKQVVLGLTSAAVHGSVDIVNAEFDRTPFSAPQSFRSFVLAPGPIPTIVSGWQDVAEAGPIVSPSGLRAYWGVGVT